MQVFQLYYDWRIIELSTLRLTAFFVTPHPAKCGVENDRGPILWLRESGYLPRQWTLSLVILKWRFEFLGGIGEEIPALYVKLDWMKQKIYMQQDRWYCLLTWGGEIGSSGGKQLDQWHGLLSFDHPECIHTHFLPGQPSLSHSQPNCFK